MCDREGDESVTGNGCMGNDFMIGSNALYTTLGNNSSTKTLNKLWNRMKFLNKHSTLLRSLKEPLGRISVNLVHETVPGRWEVRLCVTFIFVTYSAPKHENEKAENLFDIQFQHDD